MKTGMKKYAIEFVVIFVSITASFLVEEWRTSRQDGEITREYLLRLKNELDRKALFTITTWKTTNLLCKDSRKSPSISELKTSTPHCYLEKFTIVNIRCRLTHGWRRGNH